MEFTVSKKNPGRLCLYTGITGIVLLLQGLLVLPDSTTASLFVFLLGVILISLAIILYKRTPRRPFTIMGLDGDELTYTSQAYPAAFGGMTFAETSTKNINDIAYIKPVLQRIPNVGDFVELSFYNVSCVKEQAWFSRKHWEKILPILHAALDRNGHIRLAIREAELQASFIPYRERLLDADEFDAKVDASESTHFRYREKLSPGLWRLLCKLPLLVFQEVARVDQRIKPAEVRLLSDILRASDSFRSLLLAEVLDELRKSLDDSGLETGGGNIPGIVREVDNSLPELYKDEWLLFRQGIYDIGHQVANLARDRKKQLPREYLSKLQNLQVELKIPTSTMG